jgi:Fe2+ transport system protein FeoA
MVSLDKVDKNNTQVRIVSFFGDDLTRRRMLDMGIVFGNVADVMVAGSSTTPFLLSVDKSRIVVENELARYILVDVIPATRGVKEKQDIEKRGFQWRMRKHGLRT